MFQVQLDRCRRDTVVYAHMELAREQWPFPFASDAFSRVPVDALTCRTTGDSNAPLRPLRLRASHPNVCVFAEKQGHMTTLPLPHTVFVPFGSLIVCVPIQATSLPRHSRVTIWAQTAASSHEDSVEIVTVSRSRDMRESPVELLEAGETCAGPGTPLPRGRAQLVELHKAFVLREVPCTNAYSCTTQAMIEKRVSGILEQLLLPKGVP